MDYPLPPQLDPIPASPASKLMDGAMSEISEDRYAAGWMIDTERAIWAALHGDDPWGVADSHRDELAAIEALSVLAGVWVVWTGEGTTAVTRSSWAAFVAAAEAEAGAA